MTTLTKTNTFVKSKVNLYITTYAIFAVFFLLLAAQIPYTHDDWDWGIENGIDQLFHATLNSRYAGNFFEVIMTRSELVKIILMGATYFLIPFMLSRIAAQEFSATTATRTFLFLACNGFLFSMHHILWRQTYSWIAGFANYCISALFLMLWIFELFRLYDDSDQPKKDSVFHCVFYFAVAFLGQLFIENLAIYCCLIAIFLCVCYYRRCKKIPYRVIAMSVACIIGLVIMFSSSIYGSIVSDGSAVGDYRKVPMFSHGGIFHFLYQLLLSTARLSSRMYTLNPILSIVLLLLLSYLMRRENIPNMRFYRKANLILGIALLPLCIYDCFSHHATWMYFVDFLVSACYFLTVTKECRLLYHGNLRRKLLVLWFSAPLVIAPLAVTSEIGRRLFYTSNLFVILFALILLNDILHSASAQEYKHWLKLCIACVATSMIFYTVIYACIGHCKRERDEIIRNAVETGAEEIVLPNYPFKFYLHWPNPTKEHRVEYFKSFYKIPLDTEITFK